MDLQRSASWILMKTKGILGSALRLGILGSALRLVIYFLAFFSSIFYSLPLWPDLYDSNMKVQCTM